MLCRFPKPERPARLLDLSSRTDRTGFTLLELLVVLVILAAVSALVVSKVDHVRGEAEATAGRATLHTLREALTGSPVAPGYLADMKYLPAFPSVNLRLHHLLSPSTSSSYDPVTRRGWRGPYLQNAQSVTNTNRERNGLFPAAGERRFEGDTTFAERGFFPDGNSSPYGETGDLTAADPWGNPMVIQVPIDSAEAAIRLRYARVVSAGPDGVLSTPRDLFAGILADGSSPSRGDDLVLFLQRSDTYEP